MFRIRPFAIVAILCSLAMAIPAAAEESPLAQVPAQAPIVVHVRGAERLKSRLFELLKNALPNDVAQSAKTKIDELLKEGFNGRELRGLPANGSIFVVFPQLPIPESHPAAFIVRITNYGEFRDGLLKEAERKTLKKNSSGYETATLDGDEVHFAQRGDFAMVTNSKEAAAQFIKPQSGLDGKFSSDAAKRFLNADASVYVDMAAVIKAYGPKFKEMRTLIEQAIGQAMHFYANDKNTMEMVKGISELLFQAVDDSRTVVLQLNFRPDGLALQAEAFFPKETRTGELLKSFQPAPLADLAKLPSGQMVYMGMHVEPALLKRFPAALFGASSSPDNRRNQRIQEQVKRMADAKPRGRFTSAQMPLEGMQIWDYENAVEAADAYLAFVQAFKTGDNFEGMVLKEQPDIKANAVEYRDLKLHSIRVAWDIDKLIAGMLMGQTQPPEMAEAARQQMVEMLKKIVGAERKMWFGLAGNSFVQVTAKDWSSAQRQIDQYIDAKTAIGKDSAFQAARRELPDRTSVVALIEAKAYAGFLTEFIGAIGLPPSGNGGKQPIPPTTTNVPTSYLAAAVTLQPESCRLDLWVPAPAINAFYRIFEPIFKMAAAEPGK